VVLPQAKALDVLEIKRYTVVEIMPSFPGGEEKLFEYISWNFKFPRSANLHGELHVSFIVNKLGEIEDVEIVKGIRKDIDERVKKIISEMPKWKPGLYNGRPVNVKYNIPFKF
jgi:hypothetical protein